MLVQGRIRRGFSLVEVMIGVGVIALLVGVLVPTVSRARSAARLVQCTNNLQQINTSFRVWGQKNNMRLPDTSNWISAVKTGSRDGRVLYCPDGEQPEGEAGGFDKHLITHKKKFSPGQGHPEPVWTPDPTTNPNANSYVVDIKYQNQHNGFAKFIITRVAGNSWKAFAQRVDSGGGWGGPPLTLNAGSQVFTPINQGDTVYFLFGPSGTNYGFNASMANVLAPKAGKVLAMDYDKMYVDYSGDANDDNAATYLKTGRHAKGAMVNVLLTDGSVQLRGMKEVSPTTLVYRNK